METTTKERTMIATDETTRAGRMMAAGRVTVTFRSPTGQHITLTAKARGTDSEGKWVAQPLVQAKVIFIEVPNQEGWNDKVGKITRSAGFTADRNADPARTWCAKQLIKFVAGQTLPEGLEAMEDSRCGACGRQLTDPVSIERGIGPECYGRATGSKHETKTRTTAPAETNQAHEIAQDQEAVEAHEAAQVAAAKATDKQGVPMGVGGWRERQEFAKEQRAADAPKRSARHAELVANTSQLQTLPGTTWEDIFGMGSAA